MAGLVKFTIGTATSDFAETLSLIKSSLLYADETELIGLLEYAVFSYIPYKMENATDIEGVLDFSLIGILAKISGILADNKIGIFAVSTFNTDYILVKSADFARAKTALTDAMERSGGRAALEVVLQNLDGAG